MARLFGMHELTLRPGVTHDEFETFVVEELSHFLNRDGQTTYVLKGDRGVRAGKYVFVFEYDSVESRDRDTPAPNQDSEDLVVWLQEHRAQVDALFERLSTFVTPEGDIGRQYTDYVVVGPSTGPVTPTRTVVRDECATTRGSTPCLASAPALHVRHEQIFPTSHAALRFM